MDLFDLEGSEQNPVYQQVATSNNVRHYDFLRSMIRAALDSGKPWLSQWLIKAINFHAIVGLHAETGQYHTHEVKVGQYRPPAHFRVGHLMDDFVNSVNWNHQAHEATKLAAYVLWGINNIHPFVNGNGRTARATCYYVLCVKSGGLLPGRTILPEILRAQPVRPVYVDALREADTGNIDPLAELIRRLVAWQIQNQ
jgi:Fic family protein